MANVLFLFNHDAPHQVAHLAGVAAATARLHPEIDCVVGYATDRIRNQVLDIIGDEPCGNLRFVQLALPRWARWVSSIADRILPASRLLRLRLNLELFEQADLVMSTERTCLRTKKHLAPEKTPLYAKIPHGAGDRSVAYHPDYKKFDRAFVAGRKVVDQLVEHGVPREKVVVIGYPKFETVDLDAKPDFFGNGRPTFLYNPHFDPHLSSWYNIGPDLLRWFASPEGQRFNLIFAPHVMLFRKETHISPEYKQARRRPEVPEEAIEADNVLVDVDGPHLFDMAYTLSADAYIGDVSSQVYEFLVRPRPAFFLDARSDARAEDDEWHHFWKAGPVLHDLASLTAMLDHYGALGEQYREAQQELVDYTFDLSDTPASERAANAIAELLESRRA
ncbi:CDP-glycerol glycerophosphotransferase family protein [Qipengyuania sphaerica]|uniref:CDP-glycerol glycerophosphotransferase family protein n=1 Tax=Qipengyuania sphaerica TaxID=2867243 RepID=UPI001C87F098|nr:CDP-glycerol glycerophosphotransferase family protein [Qipengyuania sphaerica]MBX7540563.1 CDP-glycerol glycerophosphotransferase family protein [Qipengyuania sphaerica]